MCVCVGRVLSGSMNKQADLLPCSNNYAYTCRWTGPEHKYDAPPLDEINDDYGSRQLRQARKLSKVSMRMRDLYILTLLVLARRVTAICTTALVATGVCVCACVCVCVCVYEEVSTANTHTHTQKQKHTHTGP